MADFCNQCARDLGFPEGDLAFIKRSTPFPGMGYPELCEGCGECLVDEKGNCLDPCCLKSHGCTLKGQEILNEWQARLKKVGPELTSLGQMLLLDEVAVELCGKFYGFKIVQQVHDEYVVEVSWKGPQL